MTNCEKAITNIAIATIDIFSELVAMKFSLSVIKTIRMELKIRKKEFKIKKERYI